MDDVSNNIFVRRSRDNNTFARDVTNSILAKMMLAMAFLRESLSTTTSLWEVSAQRPLRENDVRDIVFMRMTLVTAFSRELATKASLLESRQGQMTQRQHFYEKVSWQQPLCESDINDNVFERRMSTITFSQEWRQWQLASHMASNSHPPQWVNNASGTYPRPNKVPN